MLSVTHEASCRGLSSGISLAADRTWSTSREVSLFHGFEAKAPWGESLCGPRQLHCSEQLSGVVEFPSEAMRSGFGGQM